jgi:hypothetical protein
MDGWMDGLLSLSKSADMRSLPCQVEQVVRLLLVMPVTSRHTKPSAHLVLSGDLRPGCEVLWAKCD